MTEKYHYLSKKTNFEKEALVNPEIIEEYTEIKELYEL